MNGLEIALFGIAMFYFGYFGGFNLGFSMESRKELVAVMKKMFAMFIGSIVVIFLVFSFLV